MNKFGYTGALVYGAGTAEAWKNIHRTQAFLDFVTAPLQAVNSGGKLKNFVKALFLGAVLLVSAPLALADQISFFGTDTYNTATTTINFVSSFVAVGGTGILSPFTTASTSMFAPAFNYGATPANFLLFTVTAPTGQVLSYRINSISQINTPDSSVDVSGLGTYTLTNGSTVNTAMGTFDVTTQGGGSLTSFSDINFTTAATPEPNSLVLMGTGLVSAAGMLVRRRKMIAA